MNVHAWGRYPVIDAEVEQTRSNNDVAKWLAAGQTGIAQGLARSYGDSALAKRIIKMDDLDHMLSFDRQTGLLECQSGVFLGEILETFVHQGWFLPVTPGTKFVTVGGAVSSDVHGKNHHLHGSFCDHVESLSLMLVSGEVLRCSASENAALFFATCGGMGLTGIILSVRFTLIPIKSSFIEQTTIKAGNLAQAVEVLEANHEASYSVAWIDCLSQGEQLGRSLIMLGEHSEHGGYVPAKKPLVTLPINLPGICLNKYSIKAFNQLYYHRIRKLEVLDHIHYDPFFYPLDRISQWNKMYGKKGFVQYQFLLPEESGLEGMTAVLKEIAASGRGSFLAVLKKFGKGNSNLLSFPSPGLTLALDFKYDNQLLPWLNKLDKIVLEYGGRLYLAKDARMSRSMFEQGYPKHEEFRALRESIGADKVLNSLQSQRLGF